MRDKCVEMSENANKMRDRLVELIKEELCITTVFNGEFIEATANIEEVANHLIASGVIIPPCKVGDMVHFVLEDLDEETDGKFISSQRINEVGTRGIFVSDLFNEENCRIFVPYSDFGENVFLDKAEAERALKECEPICDYTKTDWNDCCECSAKDYCDKYNERSEIIGEMLDEVIGEIKNEGR